MGSEEYPADFYQGPAYALVIGISKYKYGKESGQVFEAHEFPNLKVADKDASDFAAFLRNYPFIKYNVRELINEQAELWNIKDEFETLRKICKQPGVKNPLVIVYFSGHGWADAEGRHYLIPYEARRNKLFATALLNREFNLCLDELETNKLVVLIDTCHAGAIGEEGIKGAYDFHQDLSARDGRYFIAACGPNQKSYEWKEKQNSIFTGRLLELLNGETDDFDKSDNPEIDIAKLFPVLRDKVVATARQEYDGADQEPISEIGDGEKIVLAINKRVIERKQKESDQEAINCFLDLMCDAIRRAAGSSPKGSITTRLKSYVINKKQASGFVDFYRVFDEQFNEWKDSRDLYVFDDGCELLIDSHQFASEAAPHSHKAITQEPTSQLDNMMTPEKSSAGFQERSTIARDLGQTIAAPPPASESRPVPFDVGARPKPQNIFSARIQAGSGGPLEPPRAKVFVSYSHEDEKWLNEFKLMVAPLIQQRIIDLWDDTHIAPGKLWKSEIEKAMASTKVAVLLVSADFLNSKFIQESELPQLLDYARDKGVLIFWIMVSDCMYKETAISAYQAANKIKRPLDTLTPPECRTALRQIGEELQKLVLGN